MAARPAGTGRVMPSHCCSVTCRLEYSQKKEKKKSRASSMTFREMKVNQTLLGNKTLGKADSCENALIIWRNKADIFSSNNFTFQPVV